jgi:hypothetical protein
MKMILYERVLGAEERRTLVSRLAARNGIPLK